MESKIVRKIIAFVLCAAIFYSSSGIYLANNFLPKVSAAAQQSEEAAADDTSETQDDAQADQPVTVVRELEEERTAYSTTYLNSDGSYTSVFYAAPVRYENKEGKLVDIDTSIVALGAEEKKTQSARYDYRSKSSQADVFLPSALTGEQPVLVQYNQYQIKLCPVTSESVQRLNASERTSKEGTSQQDQPQEDEEAPGTETKNLNTVSYELQSASSGQASLIREEITDIYGATAQKETGLSYNAFSEGVEIQYIPLNEGVKENIVLNAKPSTDRFYFWFEMEGILAVLEDSGSVVLYDGETNEEIGCIPAPYVYDSSENSIEESDPVRYELQQVGGGYILSVVIDQNYLDDASRVYPVTIDPTVKLTTTSQIKDLYVLSGSYATTRFHTNTVLSLGKETNVSRSLIQFPTLQATIDKKVVTSAKFYAMVNSVSSNISVRAQRISGSWSHTNTTWNNQPASVNDIGAANQGMATHNKYMSWDITKTAGEWANGTYSNYGILLRATSETTTNHGNFYSSRHAYSDRRPYLTVTYEAPSVVDTPNILEGPSYINQARGDISLTFTPVGNLTKYELVIGAAGVTAANEVVRDISSEMTTNATTGKYEWTSEDRTIITGSEYIGFPQSARSVFAGTTSDAFDIYIRACNAKGIGAKSNKVTAAIPDRTAPNAILNDEITFGPLGNGSSDNTFNISVNFPSTTDKGTVVSNISEYVVALYSETDTQLASQIIEHVDGRDVNTANFINVPSKIEQDYINNVYAKVTPFDESGNSVTSRSDQTVEIILRPSAPKEVTIEPSGWTKEDEIIVSWNGISLNNNSVVNVYLRCMDQNENILLDNVHIGSTDSASKTLNLRLNGTQGQITIEVWAVGAEGGAGESKSVLYNKDSLAPQVEIISPETDDRIENNTFTVTSAVNEPNIASWLLTVTKEGELMPVYTSPNTSDIAGTNVIKTIDTSSFEGGSNYIVSLSVTDKAGNSATSTVSVYKAKTNDLPARESSFTIFGKTASQMLTIKRNLTPMIPVALNENTPLPAGDDVKIALFVNGALKSEVPFTGDLNDINPEDIGALLLPILDISNPEIFEQGSAENYAVLRITSADQVYYSSDIYRQKEVLPEIEYDGTTMDWQQEYLLPNNLASLKLDVADANAAFYYSINGSAEEQLDPNAVILADQLMQMGYNPNPPDNNNQNTITLRAEIQSGGIQQWHLEYEYFTRLLSNRFLVKFPCVKEVSAAAQINEMTLIRWDMTEDDFSIADEPEDQTNVSFNVYRRERNSNDEFTLIALNLKSLFYFDNNIQYTKSFEYEIGTAITSGEFTREVFSEQQEHAWAKMIDENELDKRLGLQDYWDYSSFAAGNGTVYVESSKQNLVYQTTDAVLSGPKLGLVMRRTYNSKSSLASPMGYGWDFSFNTTLLESCDDNGNVESVILKDGDGTYHVFEVVYNEQGQITEYKTPIGVRMHLSYEPQTECYRIDRNDDVSYHFDSSNVLIKMSHKSGDEITFAYDNDGKLISAANIAGQSLQFSYEEDQDLYYNLTGEDEICSDQNSYFLLKQVSVSGQTEDEPILYKFNSDYQLRKAEIPVSTYSESSTANLTPVITTQEYAYNADQGMISTIKDSEDNLYRFSYENNELIKVEFPAPSGETGESITFETDVWTFTDENGNVITNPICITKTMTPDAMTVSTQEARIRASNGTLAELSDGFNRYTYEYDENLNLISSQMYYLSTEVSRDSDDYAAVTESTKQSTTLYDYDNLSRIQSASIGGKVTSYSYEDGNNPYKVTKISAPEGRVTRYEYDPDTGNLIKETDAEGKNVSYTYDTNRAYLLTSSEDRFGNVTQYQYDTAHRLIKTVYADGSDTQILSYDARNYPTKIQDGEGNIAEYIYNEFGQTVYAKAPDGTQKYNVYDNNGRLISTLIRGSADLIPYSAGYTYDKLGRLTKTTVDGKEYTTEYGYETAGNLKYYNSTSESQVTYANYSLLYTVKEYVPDKTDPVSIQYYDSRGLLVKQGVGSIFETAVYDQAGSLVEVTGADGVTVRYAYNDLFQNTDVAVNPDTAIGLKLYYKLMDPETNIAYSASYIKYQIDRWAKDYPDFKHSAGLLGTAYSTVEKPTHNNPKSNTEFGYPAKENYYFIKNVLWK